MRMASILPQPDWTLLIITADGRRATFDVKPYLRYDAFDALRDPAQFARVANRGYYLEWECGADLSADTIEARMRLIP